ncbi:MAG TPA: hypothetical protein HA254_07780 [Candidatus Diapherotrites archaeon]|uniref:Uncharacterized protein n=1 Tax=Candidatus Iainarchaeum sp. TaxID=3101447 RepID=A0A7J4J5P0_9ARCH|nr:hypothetical protein [Candidatus Diapherotrites archaeon]
MPVKQHYLPFLTVITSRRFTRNPEGLRLPAATGLGWKSQILLHLPNFSWRAYKIFCQRAKQCVFLRRFAKAEVFAVAFKPGIFNGACSRRKIFIYVNA